MACAHALSANATHVTLGTPDGQPSRVVPLDSLPLPEPDECGALLRPLLLLEAGRSGASLVGSLVEEHDARVRVVSEPAAVRGYLSSSDLPLDEAAPPAALRELLRLLLRPLFSEQAAALLRLHPLDAPYLESVLGVLDELFGAPVPAIYMHREPVEVYMSLAADRPEWLAAQVHTGLPAVAKVRGLILDSTRAVRAANATRGGRLRVFYLQSALSGAVLPALYGEAGLFGLPRPEAWERMRASLAGSQPSLAAYEPQAVAHDAPPSVQAAMRWGDELIQFQLDFAPTAALESAARRARSLNWATKRGVAAVRAALGAASEPFIVRNGLDTWNFGKLFRGRLLRALTELETGGRPTRMLHSRAERFLWHNPTRPGCQRFEYASSWLRTKATDFASNASLYIASTVPKSLEPALPKPRWAVHLPGSPQAEANDGKMLLRLSHAGAVSPLHIVDGETLLAQVFGRTKLLLFPPEQMGALYPYPEGHCLERRAMVSVEAPDPALFPSFADAAAAAVVAHLGPRETLVVPMGWAYHAVSLEESAAISHRYYRSAWATEWPRLVEGMYVDSGDPLVREVERDRRWAKGRQGPPEDHDEL